MNDFSQSGCDQTPDKDCRHPEELIPTGGSIIGIRSIGTLNQAIKAGKAVDLINLAEALHEREYARIADMIYENRGTRKIVMIAGPSSSGKTSSSLRLALQCKVLGSLRRS